MLKCKKHFDGNSVQKNPLKMYWLKITRTFSVFFTEFFVTVYIFNREPDFIKLFICSCICIMQMKSKINILS